MALPPPLRLVTFDLGSHMAVAHNLYGSHDARVNSAHFKGRRVPRAAQTWLWLHEVFDGVKRLGGCDAVVYERPFVRGQDATRSLWGLAGLIEARAGVDGYRVEDYDPSSIKLWAAGHGNADKDAMTLAAYTMGYQGEDEHEADAFCLLRFAEMNVLAPPPKRKAGRPRVRPLKEKPHD